MQHVFFVLHFICSNICVNECARVVRDSDSIKREGASQTIRCGHDRVKIRQTQVAEITERHV